MMLIGEIAHCWAGEPVVVVGGGPSVNSDFPKIEKVKHYISCNQHGQLLVDCDYIVAIDDIHNPTNSSMEKFIKNFGKPVISGQLWADVRLHDFSFPGNTGLHAILVACILGGWPVIVIGIDCYQGKTYWHDPNALNISHGKNQKFFDIRIEQLKQITESWPIRPVSGPLSRFWPCYERTERLPTWEPFYFGEHLKGCAQHREQVFVTRKADLCRSWVHPGQTYELTATEAHKLKSEGFAKAPGPDPGPVKPRHGKPPLRVRALRETLEHPYFGVTITREGAILPYLDSWTQAKLDTRELILLGTN